MIAHAKLKYLRASPQKVRLVVDQIRGRGVQDALEVLRFSPKVVARDLEKLLKSAVANAEQREERVDLDDLRISRACVDVGPTQKRVRFRAMGRVFRILKRSSHVTLELDLKRRRELAPTADEGEAVTGKKAPARRRPAKPAATARSSRAPAASRKKKKVVARPARKKKTKAAKVKKKAKKKVKKKTARSAR